MPVLQHDDHDYDGTLQMQTDYARILNENFKKQKCQKKREFCLNWTELDLYENQLMIKKTAQQNKTKQHNSRDAWMGYNKTRQQQRRRQQQKWIATDH